MLVFHSAGNSIEMIMLAFIMLQTLVVMKSANRKAAAVFAATCDRFSMPHWQLHCTHKHLQTHFVPFCVCVDEVFLRGSGDASIEYEVTQKSTGSIPNAL